MGIHFSPGRAHGSGFWYFHIIASHATTRSFAASAAAFSSRLKSPGLQDEHQAIVGAEDLGLFYSGRTKGLQDVGPDSVGLVPALVLGNQFRVVVQVERETEACHDQTLTAATMPAELERSANVRTIAKQKSGTAMAQ